MDSVTQACLGAAIGGVVMPRLGRRALLLGAALGTLPDLDVLIDYGDAVANYTQHRGFSHSLPVLALLATLLAALTRLGSKTRQIASFGRWWWLFTLCLTTHPLLDAFTTYGTQLMWPLPTPPISWSSLFIIDPLYTLPLLIGVIVFAINPQHRRWLPAALGISSLYIGFSLVAQAHVEKRLDSALAEYGMPDAPYLVQPAPLTTLLWRVTAVNEGQAYEGWISLLDGERPVQLTPWPLNHQWQNVARATENGQRLEWFSGPYLQYQIRQIEDREQLVAVDIRLGVPGTHPFAFAIAERVDHDNAAQDWQPMVSEQLSQERPDRAAMKRLMARIINPEVVPLPPPTQGAGP